MAAFTVNSTSVMTRRMRRLMRVLQRAAIADLIAYGGCYNCKQTAGTDLWSAHAIGDALDLFPVNSTPTQRAVNIERIRKAVIRHATRPTVANRGIPVWGVRYVIGNTTKWIRGEGDSHYGGVPHTSHVHAAGSFSTSVTPPCAGA